MLLLVYCSVSEKWSPALQIRTVLLSIQALLSAPNPEDPLANDVAEQWKINEVQAIETGKHSCQKVKKIINSTLRLASLVLLIMRYGFETKQH